MTTPNLAKIELVDLREAWPNEAQTSPRGSPRILTNWAKPWEWTSSFDRSKQQSEAIL